MSQSPLTSFKPKSPEEINPGDLLHVVDFGIVGCSLGTKNILEFDVVLEPPFSVLILERIPGPYIKLNEHMSAFKCLDSKGNKIVYLHLGMLTKHFLENCTVFKSDK